MLKVVDITPLETMTGASTVAIAELLDVTVIFSPSPGAGPFRVMVPTVTIPPGRADGLTEKLLIDGGISVTSAVLAGPL
jgi:hypothetical protein